jgi:hypothetical protein
VAQEDKGLILRGFLLLALISCLVAFVLAILFWRNEPPVALDHMPPEQFVPLAALPTLAPYPANVSWVALAELSETCPSAPGFDIRYNAATTLARRGSAATPWPILLEMLDEKQQLRNSRVRQKNGQDTYDDIAARRKMIISLQAVAAWHEKRKSDSQHEVTSDMRAIYARVDDLAMSATGEVKNQAEKTRDTLFR